MKKLRVNVRFNIFFELGEARKTITHENIYNAAANAWREIFE